MPASNPVTLDLMEYASDVTAQAAFVPDAFVSQYPPAYSDAYVKATTNNGVNYYPHFSADPSKSLIGDESGQQWLSTNGVYTNQRWHIDLGSAKLIKRIYYENSHASGAYTNRGAKNFTFWGSNDAGAFAELTYGTDTGWTQLTCDISQFVQHIAANQADPRYVNVTNSIAYRYYALKIPDCWGSTSLFGLRRIGLQASPINCFSESTIKQDGSYSLKSVAAAIDSLNKTLTRTVSPVINLTDKTIIKFDIRASRTGSNIKIGIHDSGGTTTEITPNIVTANTWQTVMWDISAVSNANKDAIDSIIVTIVNADAENTFYIDNMFADIIPNYLIHRGRDRFRTTGISLG